MHNSVAKFIVAVFLLTFGSIAFAHTGHGVSGWGAGWAHPFSGLDHMLAMVAVGLWALQGGGRRIWLLPVTFMTMLAAGASVSMIWQHPLPVLETGIALSVLALGLLIALSMQLPIWKSMAITALFGMFHGYAHGLELPESAAPFVYAIGFLLATALLHLGGIVTGAAMHEKYAMRAKIAGGVIAMSGAGLLAFPS